MAQTGDGLTPERWESVKELFLRALELPETERAAFVAHASGADADLARAVNELLADRVAATPLEDVVGLATTNVTTNTSSAPRTLGPCTLLEELGSGSMGTVYRARQTPPGREVAVKVLHTRLASDERSVERFRRESARLARLVHPGIVQVYFVDAEAGQHFFVMELVRGHDLGAELTIQRGEGGERTSLLPRANTSGYFAAVAKLCRDAALVLEHAHRSGVVHRDVKPQNLLLALDGTVKLTDFGIARDESMGTLTRTGDVVGTPYYMSPEQAKRGMIDVDHRSDVYSLGVVLYELLTLRRPFDGPSHLVVMQRILDSDPPLPRRINAHVPRDLEAICCKAMARSASQRYAWAADLAADLDRFLAHEAVHARPIGALERSRRWARRHRVKLAAAGLVALGATLGWGTVRAQESSDKLARYQQRMNVYVARPARSDAEFDALRALLVEYEQDAGARAFSEHLAGAYAQLKEQEAQRTRALEARAVAAMAVAFPTPRMELAGTRTNWDGGPTQLVDSLVALAQHRGSLPADLAKRLAAQDEVQVRVRVLQAGAGACRVVAEPLDPIHGQPAAARPLTSTLAAGDTLVFRVPPGPVRLWIVADDGRFAELARDFAVQVEPFQIDAKLVSDADACRGMLSVPSGTCTISYSVATPGPTREMIPLQHALPTFFVDPRPVTNGEYAAFLDATQRPRPDWWPKPWTPEFDALPATRVNHDAARDYAEWRGKRLLTEAEWQWAVRGALETNRFPARFDPERPDFEYFNLARAQRERGITDPVLARAEILRWTLATLRPAGYLEGAALTPGLTDVLGNVNEWTDTWAFDRTQRGYERAPGLFVLVGSSCLKEPLFVQNQGFAAREENPAEQHRLDTGFRCARSARPPDVK